jgi:hypothetical protein
MNAQVAHWTVEIHLSERDGQTHADARLISGTTRPLHAVGTARFNPHDRMDISEVGYEVAAARALHELADLLQVTAEGDVSALRTL